MMKVLNCLPIMLLALLTACAANKVTEESHSGFLANYAQLQPSEIYPNSKVFVESDVNFSNYKSLMIDKVVILSSAALENPNDSLMRSIATQYEQELKDSFRQQGYKIVNQAGAGTARIQTAITSVYTSFDDLKAYQYIPIAAAITGTMRATGKAKRNARVMMEAKVTDAKTNQLLASIIDLQKGEEVDEGNKVSISDVKPVLKQWATRFAKAFASL